MAEYGRSNLEVNFKLKIKVFEMIESEKIYSPLNKTALFMIQRRLRVMRDIFSYNFPYGVENIKLFEIGCGNGQWFAEFATLGFNFANFAGIEIDPIRVTKAKDRIPFADIQHGDASKLPWDDDSFDVVFQSTVFTSIKDESKQNEIASEMKRVCKKTGGFVLWYDFIYDNPSNPDVKGISKLQIKKLFEPWNCEFRSVTLAPPIARRVVPISWSLAEDLETFFPFLRTHLISVIKPV